MPYVVTREVASLGLQVGDELKHEKGKLPAALTFDTQWCEPEAAVKEAPKAKAKK